MADGINAAAQANEPLGGQPMVDRVFAEPGSDQLAPSHETMLARRDRPNLVLDGI